MVPAGRQDLIDIMVWFTRPHWLYTEDGDTVAIAEEYGRDEDKVRFDATDSGRNLLDVIFPQWKRIFMD